MTKTTITTPATLPGAAPVRRCPSCGIGYVMAGDPPVLAWEGTCNRCGHVVAPEPDATGTLAHLSALEERTCLDCPTVFQPANANQVRCKPCARARHMGQINAARAKRRKPTREERRARQERERIAARERWRATHGKRGA